MIRPATLPEAVLRELRRNLMVGRFQPGDRIRVDRIAAELGVSPVPVREALRVLLAEGRVELAPHRGYTVTVLSAEQVEEIFLICRILEAEAIRRGVPAMGLDGAEEMRRYLSQLETMPARDSMWDRVALHRDFHFVPIRRAGLPLLEAELRRLWDHTDHLRGLYFFRDEKAYRDMAPDHRAIADTCASGDAERAVQLMDEHRAHALEGIARLVPSRGEEA